MAETKPTKSHRRGAGRPFAKGDSRICRDPDAKSKGKQFQAFVRDWLESPADVSSEPGKARAEVLLDVLWEAALSGTKDSIPAVEALLNRAYGKPSQPIASDPENPISLTFSYTGGVTPPSKVALDAAGGN